MLTGALFPTRGHAIVNEFEMFKCVRIFLFKILILNIYFLLILNIFFLLKDKRCLFNNGILSTI